jgi:hypothetical protein
MSTLLITAKHIDKDGCCTEPMLAAIGKAGPNDAIAYSREAARRTHRSYNGVTFDEMFIKLDGRYFERESTLTCENCATVFLDRSALDGEFRCEDCAEYYAEDQACTARHERLECTWSV